MRVYGFKIKDLMNFINPKNVLMEGENYVIQNETWNIMKKRSDERYKEYWSDEIVAKVVVGLITDEIYGSKEVMLGELYKGDLIVYPKTMGIYTPELNTYLECTPDSEAFEERVIEVLKLISDEQIDPNGKTKTLPSVEFGFYEVEE